MKINVYFISILTHASLLTCIYFVIIIESRKWFPSILFKKKKHIGKMALCKYKMTHVLENITRCLFNVLHLDKVHLFVALLF